MSKYDDHITLKSKLSLYQHYAKRIQASEDRLVELAVIMGGVKSSANYPPIRNDNPTYTNNVIRFMDEEQELIELKRHDQEVLKELDALIDSIENETDRNMISDCYKEGVGYTELAGKYSYADKHVIFKKINKILANL